MVGHELPNARPFGEDHHGAGDGETPRRRGTRADRMFGVRESALSRSSTATIRIHRALDWLHGVRGFLAILFISPG